MSRQVLAWLAVALGIAGVLGGLGYYKYAEIETAIAAAAAFPEQQESVESARVHRGEWTPTSSAVGTVVAMRQVEIRNELPGTVVEIGFASGDIVKAGQMLVRFDTRQEVAMLLAAQAEAELARVTLERRKKLRDNQNVSEQALEDRKSVV